ncbi:MAG TPA: NAD(P)H-dependent oxidoreductase subunit E [Rectinemataceae bacterium]|nr:NAD(P)H-dependent oxidoreductase subunit E [Rectinemataceae bacterium]
MPSVTAKQSSSGIERIVRNNLGTPGSLLKILEQVQEIDPKHYLSEETLKSVSELVKVPLSQVYSMATFYSFFNLKPQGKHSIVVCRGTACHTRGSLALLNEALSRMGIHGFKEEEENSATSPDGFASIRTVACFGQCALAPVVMIDGVVKSRMTIGKLVALLEKINKGGDK